MRRTALVALSLLLAACGTAVDAGTTSTPASTTSSTPAATAPATTSPPTTAPPPPLISLVGAGFSFGMCGGFCLGDLHVEGDDVVFVAGSNMRSEPLFVNRGILTAAGRDRLESALADLGDTPLDDVYGCPDCADGGAAYVTLEREGTITRHSMEYGRPPTELTALREFTGDVIEALTACSDPGGLITPDSDCNPWQEP